MFEVAQSNCAWIFPTERKMFCENLKEIQSLDQTLQELYTYFSSSIVKNGLVRDLGPGPLASEARIISLDKRVKLLWK